MYTVPALIKTTLLTLFHMLIFVHFIEDLCAAIALHTHRPVTRKKMKDLHVLGLGLWTTLYINCACKYVQTTHTVFAFWAFLVNIHVSCAEVIVDKMIYKKDIHVSE